MTVMEHQRTTRAIQVGSIARHHAVDLTVAGELDSVTADRVISAGRQALAGYRNTTLAIDLSEVTFIDAAGLGALIAIRNHATSHDNGVEVVEPSRCVLRILDLTALASTFMPRDRAHQPNA